MTSNHPRNWRADHPGHPEYEEAISIVRAEAEKSKGWPDRPNWVEHDLLKRAQHNPNLRHALMRCGAAMSLTTLL